MFKYATMTGDSFSPALFRLRLRRALSAALAAFLALYVAWALRKFFGAATAANSFATDKSSFSFPTVTVCGDAGRPPLKTPPNMSWVVKALHTLTINGSRHDFLDVSPNSSALTKLGLSVPDLWDSRLETLDFASFFCNTYRPPEGAETPFMGANTVLTLHLRSPSGGPRHFNVYVGHRGGLATSASFGAALLLARGEGGGSVNFLSYSVAFKRSQYLRKAHWKCVPEGEKAVSQQKCLDEYISSRHPCFSSLINAPDVEALNSSCNPKQLEEIVKLKSELQSGGVGKFMSRTGCVPSCTMFLHEVELRNSFSIPSGDPALDAAAVVPAKEGEAEAEVVLHFFIANPLLTVTEEYWVYDGHSLIGDVGGMIGMLLGTSVLVVYDFFADAAGRMSSGCKRKRREKKERL